MKSLGALVVGIGAYRPGPSNLSPLAFAARDAEGFVRYLAQCWPGDEAVVEWVPETEATQDRIDSSRQRLRDAGPFDLFIVFLSGHGLLQATLPGHPTPATGFLVQPGPDDDSVALLAPAALDRLLADVTAARTIMVLDCCNAEGIVQRMSFFQALGPSEARLFVASSRSDQLTWEDASVQHGIFTAYLIDLLNSGSSVQWKGRKDRLDVDGELFPALCAQVPLYVLEHKRKRQEPVKGGVAMRSVVLPVARFARRVNDRSPLRTALVRLRQLLVGAVAAAVVGMAALYALAYYAAIDEDGHVRLKHGIHALRPIFDRLPSDRLDAGLSRADLSEERGTQFLLDSGAIGGAWTHRTVDDVRGWYAKVRPILNSRVATRLDVLGAFGAEPARAALGSESRPRDVALAAWALLDRATPGEIDTVLSHVLGADRIDTPTTPIGSDMDFNVLDRTLADMRWFAQALQYAATVDPDRAFVGFVGHARAAALWLTQHRAAALDPNTHEQLTENLAGVLRVIGRARQDQGLGPPLSPAMIDAVNSLSPGGWGRLAVPAMHRVMAQTGQLSDELVDEALTLFKGNVLDPRQVEALALLSAALDGSPRSIRTFDRVHAQFLATGNDLHAQWAAFLIEAAKRGSLSQVAIQTALDKAHAAIKRSEYEFEDVEYAKVLAHGMPLVPPASRPLVHELVETLRSRLPPSSSEMATLYGALADRRMDTQTIRSRVFDQTKSVKRGVMTRADTPLPGLQIVVGRGPWLDALARIGVHAQLPEDMVAVLQRHASDPALREGIVRALRHQPSTNGSGCWASRCGGLLRQHAHDAVARALQADILALQVSQLPRTEFLQALAVLDTERRRELEPEVRIELGRIRMEAQRQRVHSVFPKPS